MTANAALVFILLAMLIGVIRLRTAVVLAALAIVLLPLDGAQATERFEPVTPEPFVAGLVVSEEPTPGALADYARFNANGVVLWEAHEASAWSEYPTIVWVDEEGLGVDVAADGTRNASPVDLPANVVGLQVGDEPSEIAPDLAGYGLPAYTNFSYWGPQAAGATDLEAALDGILANYAGDRLSISEYLLDPFRLDVLRYFSDKARELEVPLWAYLNAYSGYETDMSPAHELSDLRWSAYTAQAYGAKGFVWFAYQLGDVGHPEAVAGGGSILTEAPGEWGTTEHFEMVAGINLGLRRLGYLLDGHPRQVNRADGVIVAKYPGADYFVNNSFAYGGRESLLVLDLPAGFAHFPNGYAMALPNGGPVTVPAGSAMVWSETLSPGWSAML